MFTTFFVLDIYNNVSKEENYRYIIYMQNGFKYPIEPFCKFKKGGVTMLQKREMEFKRKEEWICS